MVWLLAKAGCNSITAKPIDNFIVDFYIASSRLVIEIDGESHYSENGKIYDAQRTAILESYGLTILRFTNTQVMKRFNDVCREIEKQIPVGPRTNPPCPPLLKGDVVGSP